MTVLLDSASILQPSDGAASLTKKGLKKEFPHGVRARYVRGCRCDECRQANREYFRRYEINPVVDATPAREHIKKLGRAGVGLRIISEVCDVPRLVLQAIKAGERKGIRARALQRILKVSTQCRADAALVPAASTLRRLETLREEGFSRSFIAKQLGLKRPVLEINRHRVTVRTRARIERVFEALTS